QRDQVLGRLVEEVFPGEAGAMRVQKRREAIHSGGSLSFESAVNTPAGQRWVHSTLTPVFDAQGRCAQILTSVHDLTAQRQADRARRESEARLALQYAVAREAATGDPLPEVAPRFLREVCQVTGWQVGGLWKVDRAANVLHYVAGWHTPDAPFGPFIEFSKTHAFAPGIGMPGRVWTTRVPQWVADVTGSANIPRAPRAAALGLRTALGLPLMLDGAVLGVLEFFSADIRRPDTQMTQTLEAVALQIAQVLQGHLKDAQLRQAQKMEAVGQLAGGIAHDFNNLLVVINGHCELMLSKLHTDDPLRRELELILQTGERAASLTRQMLVFSRREVQDLRVLDLNSVVAELDKMLHRLLPENIGLKTLLAPALDRVRADPTQVQQVILNLVVNARDAMPQEGKLTIETANVLL
ncbi:MAG TPA: GAF domain-containing protein, partial [bacterium]|nr:GAF domain-containing protein [bacterium]